MRSKNLHNLTEFNESFLNFRHTELFVNNCMIHEYIDRILKDERVSLNDSMIANFIEIYYGKVRRASHELSQI